MTQGNQSVTYVPLSPAEQSFFNTGRPCMGTYADAVSDWTPAFAPLPGPGGSSPGNAVMDVPGALCVPGGGAGFLTATWDVPDVPACAVNVVVTITADVAISGSPLDTAGVAPPETTIAFLDINVPAFGGFYTFATHGWTNIPGDFGSPAVTISATSAPLTAAQFNAAKFYILCYGSEQTLVRTYTLSNVSLSIVYDDSGCSPADLTTSVTPGAANTIPGQCDGMTVTVTNAGPNDVGDMVATITPGGTSGNTDVTITAAPYRPTGYPVNIGPIGGPYADASTLSYPITYAGGFDVQTLDMLTFSALSYVTVPVQVCTPSGAAIGSTTTVSVSATDVSGAVDPDASNNSATGTLTVVQPLDDISVTTTPSTGTSAPSLCHSVQVVASNSGPNTPLDYTAQLVPGGTSGNTDVTVHGVSYSGANAGEIGPIGGPYVDTNLVTFPATYAGGAEVISHPGGGTQSLAATGARLLTPTELAACQGFLTGLGATNFIAVSNAEYSAAFSGGSVDITMDGPSGGFYEEQFVAADLPAIPACATGTVTIQGSITVEGIGGTALDNYVGVGLIDSSQSGVAALITAVNGVGSPGPIVLTLPPTSVSAAAYQSGSIAAVSGFVENAIPSTFRVTNASFSVTYDASTCATTVIDAEVCTPPSATAGQTTTLDASVSITGATDPNPANDTANSTFVVSLAGITVAPTTLNIEAGCGPEAETLVVTNGTGAALDGALVSIVVPAGMTIRSATLVYAGGASGPSTAPSGTFVVGDWPDGGSITVAFEVVAGCTTPGTYAGSVDVSLAGSPIASVPLTIVRA